VDKTPVTNADRAINTFIVGRLKTAYPDDNVVAEEDDFFPENIEVRRTWFVDPIDGTKSFLSRTGQWAVSIGLIKDGVNPVLGVVYMPPEGVMYFAVQGCGAFRMIGDGAPERISCSTVSTLEEVTIVKSRESKSEFIEDLCSNAAIIKSIYFGSLTLRVMQVASGAGDLYISNGNSSLWDICAAQCVMTEAGGVIRYFDSTGVSYSGTSTKCKGPIVATSTGIFKHTALLDLITETKATSTTRMGVRATLRGSDAVDDDPVEPKESERKRGDGCGVCQSTCFLA